MRTRNRALVGVVLAATVLPGLPAVASRAAGSVAPKPPLVTGHVGGLADYAARGLTPRQAALALLLDRLAGHGVPVAALEHLARAADGAEPSSTAQDPYVLLSAVGDLDRRAGADVLEQRLSSGKSATTTTLVARSGRTGAVLWRSLRSERDGFVIGVAANLGARQLPGVLLLGGGFEQSAIRTTLTALDGTGRQLWSRTVRQGFSDPQSSASLGASSAGSYAGTFVLPSQRLRRGPLDAVIVQEEAASQDTSTGSRRSGAARMYAVSSVNGALRALPGATSSDSGAVSADVVGDQDGDGYSDLAVVDGGDTHTATVLRDSGAVVWQRTDVPTYGAGYLTDAGGITGAARSGRRVADVALVTAAAPGTVGAVTTPTGEQVLDPTAAAHGTVTLLAGGTGTTVWAKPGEGVYVLTRAGRPAVGVVTITDTSSATTVSVRLTVTTYDAAGTALWDHSVAASVPSDSSGFAFTGGSAFALDDLDADGGLEGVLVAYAVNGTGDDLQEVLVDAAHGAPLRDQRSGLLFAGVTRRGHDRVDVASGSQGLVVTVRRGRDGASLLHRLVPGSRGVQRGSASGAVLTAAPCADVLVAGSGGGHAVIAVLASDGRPRWSVGRLATDSGAGRRQAFAPSPAVRC